MVTWRPQLLHFVNTRVRLEREVTNIEFGSNQQQRVVNVMLTERTPLPIYCSREAIAKITFKTAFWSLQKDQEWTLLSE